jgi:Mrp family chromosome partitioning ATPase
MLDASQSGASDVQAALRPPAPCVRMPPLADTPGARVGEDPRQTCMATVIAVANQKGGVGKTTTTANLGAALALRGKRVLLVDLDPQGNLTSAFGLEKDVQQTVAESLLDRRHSTARRDCFEWHVRWTARRKPFSGARRGGACQR